MSNQQTPIQSFASSARGAETKFLPAVLYALEQFENGNYSQLYSLIAFVRGVELKGGLRVLKYDGENESGLVAKQKRFAPMFKRILARSFSETTFSFKDGQCKVKKSKQGGLNAEVVRELRDVLALYNNNIVIDHKAVQSLFPAVKAKKSDKTRSQEHKRLTSYIEKFAEDMGMSVAEVLAFAQAKPEDVARTEQPEH